MLEVKMWNVKKKKKKKLTSFWQVLFQIVYLFFSPSMPSIFYWLIGQSMMQTVPRSQVPSLCGPFT